MQKKKNTAKDYSELKGFQTLLIKKTKLPVNQQLTKQRILKALTSLQVNYRMYTYLYLLQKCTSTPLSQIKIGVIGCGSMGRLILNNLVILSKEGLSTYNILVSTRQPENLSWYSQQFGISVFFDNERVMEQSDIVFIATPATFDNWIIVDLKESYNKRCQRMPKPLVFSFTSNVDLGKWKNIMGNGHVLLPSVNYKVVEEFVRQQPTYSQMTRENLEQTLENFMWPKIQQSIPHLYNVMAFVFLNWQTTLKSIQQIEANSHEALHSCFKKPSPQQIYRQRCKMWRSAVMNFQ